MAGQTDVYLVWVIIYRTLCRVFAGQVNNLAVHTGFEFDGTTEKPRIPDSPPPTVISGPKLHLIALNNPMTGDMRDIRGADYMCHRQVRQAGYLGTYRAFLSSQNQTLDSIIFYESDRHIPLVNAKDELLFNKWTDMMNEAGDYISRQSRIYAFNGKDIMHDSAWPQKIMWHGSDKRGTSRSDECCRNWQSRSHSEMGLASSLMKGMLLDKEEFSCNNSFIVLCMETTSSRSFKK